MFSKAKLVLRDGEVAHYDVTSGRVDAITVDEIGISIFKRNCCRTYPYGWLKWFDLSE